MRPSGQANFRVSLASSFPAVFPARLSLPLFVVATAFVVVGQLLVLRAGAAGRLPGAGTSRASRAQEALWIILPALVLAALLVSTWRALPRVDRPTVTSNGVQISEAAQTTGDSHVRRDRRRLPTDEDSPITPEGR